MGLAAQADGSLKRCLLLQNELAAQIEALRRLEIPEEMQRK
jgi:hypothetical protein